MAQKVYELIQYTHKEAFWQLSDKERQSLLERLRRLRTEAGGQLVVHIRTWSSDCNGAHVYVYADMDAYHRYASGIGPEGLNARRYWDYTVTLGYERPK